jgi:hypothetical protein
VSLILLYCILVVNLISIYSFCYVYRSWINTSFDGASKQILVNQVLGNMFHLHYPGVVTLPRNDCRELVTNWDHYRYAPDGDYMTAQGAVSHDF